jgi:hypothetical protein
MRFHDVVGFSTGTVETPPDSGVMVEQMVERTYTGDVIRNTRQISNPDKVNFDLTVSNTISIVADMFANETFEAIRYCKWMGALWVVTNVEPRRPRLLLTLGGVYDGPTPEPSG